MHLSQKIQTQHELLCDSLLGIFNHDNFLKFCHVVLFLDLTDKTGGGRQGRKGTKWPAAPACLGNHGDPESTFTQRGFLSRRDSAWTPTWIFLGGLQCHSAAREGLCKEHRKQQ